MQRSVQPATNTDSAVTPIVQTKIVDITTQHMAPDVQSTSTSKPSPPCDECGATVA